MTITKPEEVVRDVDNPRMPTFGEFVWLYVQHNSRIHEVINKFTLHSVGTFKISPALLGEGQRLGLEGWNLVQNAYAFARSGTDFKYVGEITKFVPSLSSVHSLPSYFVLSHPFDEGTIKGKLKEREVQGTYISTGSLQTALVKTICLTHPDGGYVLASLSGASSVDWKKLSDALGFSNSQKRRMRYFDGSLEEALGMRSGRVTPLVDADKLPNIVSVVIDSLLENPLPRTNRSGAHLEIPINVESYLLREVKPLFTGVWKRDGSVDISGKRDNALVYSPAEHSLANALKLCYGAEKVRVADISNAAQT